MIGPKLPTITMPAGSYTTQWDTTGTVARRRACASAGRLEPGCLKPLTRSGRRAGLGQPHAIGEIFRAAGPLQSNRCRSTRQFGARSPTVDRAHPKANYRNARSSNRQPGETIVLATRMPTLTARKLGEFLPRFAERRPSASLPREPPRRTRDEQLPS